MSYEEIPHTADIKIRARAKTLELLFSEAFDALMHVVYGKNRNGEEQKIIEVHASDPESLLADFLSEVLFVSEVEGLVFSRADITINDPDLTAILFGEPFDQARHSEGTEVKGISYSGLSIRKDTNGYILDILFDV
ncbi:archease [uncultured Methanoregula sp.]|uniref:archease n=1 Tax=uncultured Methanoregula sp. TaxID=1005933 RepID=UPI002AAB4909|nr:archease [uncultured Methanoregula sp.]